MKWKKGNLSSWISLWKNIKIWKRRREYWKMKILKQWKQWRWTIWNALKNSRVCMKRSCRWSRLNIINWNRQKMKNSLIMKRESNKCKEWANRQLKNFWMILKMNYKLCRMSMIKPRERQMGLKWNMKKSWLSRMMMILEKSDICER